MDTFIRQLRELIKKMLIELSPNNIFLRDILEEQRNTTLEVQATAAMQLIRELQDSLYKVEYSDNWPLLRILIAFCYCRLNDVHTARSWTEDAVRILNATNKEWNLAFAYWFLAIVYGQEGYFKDSREQYINAQKTFYQIRNNAPNSNVGYRLKKECSKRIRQIHHRITGIPHGRSRLLDSARRDPKVNITFEKHDIATDRPSERNSGGNVLSAPINVNIHVPIDNRSADHVDQRSLQFTQLQQDQFANQEQESLLGSSIPLGIDFTNVSKPPSFSSSKPADSQKPADVNKETLIPIDVSELGYLMTPSLPVYGTASAGPNGEVVLEEPDYDAAIDESHFVRIDKGEYEVHSLKSDKRRINISYTDFVTSVIPKEDRKNDGKVHGWLLVIGNSMNDAQPINIEDGDYLLFYKNKNIRACIGRITVVSESMPDSGPIRLLVKRLVSEANQLVLRSYSRDKNPDTGREFEDLVFNECYQLIGEVVAVAKPRSPEKT